MEERKDNTTNGALNCQVEPKDILPEVAVPDLKKSVEWLKEDFNKFSKALAVILTIFEKLPSMDAQDQQIPFDLLDLGSELLAIPSSYFSDMLGGSTSRKMTDRMTAVGRLELICQVSRHNKLVLVVPQASANDYNEFKSPVLRGHIMPSSTATAKGDATGLPVATMLSMRRDQLWLLQTNGLYIPARKQGSDYQGVNEDCRKPYEYALKVMIDRAFLFSNAELFSKKLLQMAEYDQKMEDNPCPNPTEEVAIPSSFAYRCDNLALYTVLSLREYLFDLIGFELEYIKALSTISDILHVIDKCLLPKLKNAYGVQTAFEFPELSTSFKQIKSWLDDSKFAEIRKKIYAQKVEFDSEAFLRNNKLSALCGLVHEPVIVLEKIIRKTQVIFSMHPEDDSEELTPIHAFSYRLMGACRALLPQIKVIAQFMGQVDDHDVCKDKKSLLSVYAELRGRYLDVFRVALCSNKDSLPPSPSLSQSAGALDSSKKASIVAPGSMGHDLQSPVSSSTRTSPRRSPSVASSPRDAGSVTTAVGSVVPRSPHFARSQNPSSRNSSPRLEPSSVVAAKQAARSSPGVSPREDAVVDLAAVAGPGYHDIRSDVTRSGQKAELKRTSMKKSTARATFFDGSTDGGMIRSASPLWVAGKSYGTKEDE